MLLVDITLLVLFVYLGTSCTLTYFVYLLPHFADMLTTGCMVSDRVALPGAIARY